MPSYLAELVSRTPAAAGPPSFEVVAPISFGSLSCTWELSRDGAADLSTTIRQLDDQAKWHLADPFRRPCELQIIRDGLLWWRGPVWTVGIQRDTVNIHCRGLAAYLRGMIIGPETGTQTFDGVDQHLIVKQLIDVWQTLPYGHFGLDTGGIGTSGVARDRVYPASELHDVYSRVGNLTEVQGGFDFEVAADRQVVCHHPQQGTVRDLFLDARNIGSADEQRAASDGRVCTVAYAETSVDDEVDGDGDVVVAAPDAAVAVDQDVLERFGRWAYAETRDGVSDQATLDGYAQAALEARRTVDWQPGPGLRPVRELEVDAVGVGDTVRYVFDAGLGLRDEPVRVVRKQVGVGRDGDETLALEVA